MGSYKAPGPYGYKAILFKNSWCVTGAAVYAFVREIKRGGEIPIVVAEALLVLIPKEMRPCSMKGFRPLSVCNIMYKLISMVIVSGLKKAWSILISPYQASFVPGRQALDNVVPCQEFVHFMGYTKARKGTVIIKL